MRTANDRTDDGIPLQKPISYGRDGPEPLIIRLPTLRDEARKIAELLSDTHQQGHASGDMAVICSDYATLVECASALSHRKLPHQVRQRSGDYKPDRDAIGVLTMGVSKGLEFLVVMLPGVGQMPAAGEDENEEVRLVCGDSGHADAGDNGELAWGLGGDWTKKMAAALGQVARLDNDSSLRCSRLSEIHFARAAFYYNCLRLDADAESVDIASDASRQFSVAAISVAHAGNVCTNAI